MLLYTFHFDFLTSIDWFSLTWEWINRMNINECEYECEYSRKIKFKWQPDGLKSYLLFSLGLYVLGELEICQQNTK